MMRTHRFGAMVVVTASLVLASLAQNGNETGPPALAGGGYVVDPLPPPPPQPATAVQARVAFTVNERGQMVLRLEAQGAPGAAFLVGVLRPGTSRPVVLTTAILNVEGRWSYERALTPSQARALSQAEFVFASR